jgi:hypothetical protein
VEQYKQNKAHTIHAFNLLPPGGEGRGRTEGSASNKKFSANLKAYSKQFSGLNRRTWWVVLVRKKLIAGNIETKP